MAKKGPGLLGLIAIGAAAAGTYYYLKKKDEKIPSDMGDDEDIDSFDQDLDDGPASTIEVTPKRSYTSLNFDTVEKKVQDAVSSFADTANKTAATVTEKLQKAAGKVEEFFDDRKPCEEVKEEPIDGGEPTEEDYEEPLE